MNEYKSKEWLEDKYINQDLSTYKIAKICGVTAEAIRYWMKKHKIAARPKNDYQKKLELIKRKKLFETLLNDTKLDDALSDYIERHGLI
jgi:predicted DNA-binding protein YlxM (UPF0122 family)